VEGRPGGGGGVHRPHHPNPHHVWVCPRVAARHPHRTVRRWAAARLAALGSCAQKGGVEVGERRVCGEVGLPRRAPLSLPPASRACLRRRRARTPLRRRHRYARTTRGMSHPCAFCSGLPCCRDSAWPLCARRHTWPHPHVHSPARDRFAWRAVLPHPPPPSLHRAVGVMPLARPRMRPPATGLASVALLACLASVAGMAAGANQDDGTSTANRRRSRRPAPPPLPRARDSVPGAARQGYCRELGAWLDSGARRWG
jgi:hypothetical protein